MYLMTRVLTIAPGRLRDGLKFATDITEYVNANSSVSFNLGMGVFGRPVGTVVWSGMFESQAQFLDVTAVLLANPGYLERVDAAGGLFTSSPEDAFREIVHTAGDVSGPLAYTSAVLATINADRAVEAISWSIEMADLVNKLTGAPTMFLTDTYGPFGGVAFISGAADAAALDTAHASIRGNSDYLAKMAGSAGMFIPGSGRTVLLQRIM